MNNNRLVFYYGAMNCGKSLNLLAFAAKLRNKNIPYIVVKPQTDTRDGDYISSRPLQEKLKCDFIWDEKFQFPIEGLKDIRYILIDEAQFLSTYSINYFADIVDNDLLNVNVICYGLRTDFQSNLFEGSKRLFEIADELHEIDDIDEFGNKVIINARINKDGDIVEHGPQVEIGAEDKYQSMSRKKYNDKIRNQKFWSKSYINPKNLKKI